MKNILAVLMLLYTFDTFSQSIEKQEDNNIYSSTGLDVKPEFPGGLDKLNALVNESYLKSGYEWEVKGKVYSIFVIEKDGSLSDVKILRGLDSLKAATLIQILKNSPKWNPGKQNGKIVRVHYVLPLEIGN